MTRDRQPAKPKIFTLWFFMGKKIKIKAPTSRLGPRDSKRGPKSNRSSAGSSLPMRTLETRHSPTDSWFEFSKIPS